MRRGIGSDRRIGHHFLFPGVGYGGSCFPKDVQAIIRTAHDAGMEFPLLNAVEDVNERQKQLLVEKVVQALRRRARRHAASPSGASPSSRAPTTCARRRRSSSSRSCSKRGARVEAHDPEALGEARKVFGDRINYHRVNYDALQGADALLIVTEWSEFRRPDFARMKTLHEEPDHLRRPQSLRARRDARAGLHLLSRSAGRPWRRD